MCLGVDVGVLDCEPDACVLKHLSAVLQHQEILRVSTHLHLNDLPRLSRRGKVAEGNQCAPHE